MNVRVAVQRQSGNPEIRVQSGADLIFTPANWNSYQTVRLAATSAYQDIGAPAVFLLSSAEATSTTVEAERVKKKPSRLIGILNLLLE
jgi:hypothetical protein